MKIELVILCDRCVVSYIDRRVAEALSKHLSLFCISLTQENLEPLSDSNHITHSLKILIGQLCIFNSRVSLIF